MNCIDNIRNLNANDTQLLVLPTEIEFHAMAVNFADLNKIRSTVGLCEGFDLSDFDKIILVSWFSLFNLITTMDLSLFLH